MNNRMHSKGLKTLAFMSLQQISNSSIRGGSRVDQGGTATSVSQPQKVTSFDEEGTPTLMLYPELIGPIYKNKFRL